MSRTFRMFLTATIAVLAIVGSVGFSGAAAQDAASVSGRVFVDQAGTAIVGAEICIDGTDLCATSQAGGYYSIGGVPNGEYFVTASASGYSPQTLAHTVAGVAGGPNFYLQPIAASVAGQVFNAHSGDPLVGATVCVDETGQCTTSVDGGYYVIGGVLNGDYNITASMAGYVSQTTPHTVAAVTGGPDFSLSRDAASVAGQVFHQVTGAPLVGATVCVDQTGQCATSVAGGYYSIGGVFNGDYTVTASMNGFVSQSAAHSVAGVNGGPNFSLLPNAASVTGQVFENFTGVPLVGATVCVDGTDQCTTSVDGGYYAIGGVFNGDYFVTASLDGYGSQTLAHNVAGVNGGPNFYLDPIPVDEVIPVAPEVPELVAAVCDDDNDPVLPSLVVPEDTDGITYGEVTVGPANSVALGLTATANDGYTFEGATMPEGWTMVSPTEAVYEIVADTVECPVDPETPVEPEDPKDDKKDKTPEVTELPETGTGSNPAPMIGIAASAAAALAGAGLFFTNRKR